MNAHRTRDIFDLLFAHVFEREIELVADLVAHHPADANTPRRGERLKARRDIDTVPVDVVAVDDDVADIDADAKLDAPIDWNCGIALVHATLDLDRAAHCVDDAGEFDQCAVTGGLDDAAAMLGDLGIDQRDAVRF